MYPKLTIYTKQLTENAKKLLELCDPVGVRPTAVVKVTDGAAPVAAAALEGGITSIGDSRTENLKRYQEVPGERLLIRSSMMSGIPEVVAFSHLSIESHIPVLKTLSKEALLQGKVHKVLLGVELGDLREGIYGEEALLSTAKIARDLQGIEVVGVSGNFNDLSAIAPTPVNLKELYRLGTLVAEINAIEDPIFSGGNSSTLELIRKGTLPQGINHIRTGVGFLEGRIDNLRPRMEGFWHHPFVLTGEVIEAFRKPSLPWGEFGANLDFAVPDFEDRGMRRRVILALGRADTDTAYLEPLDEGLKILGSCSDHMVLDAEDCPRDFAPGDKVSFYPGYLALLRSFSSRHVEKVYS